MHTDQRYRYMEHIIEKVVVHSKCSKKKYFQ